ncbi:MAG TPA: hypothetical protein VN132_05530 [Bdellovibrio sp.]|nr:hypothetical protein [Bdellovibrio sp.]
MKNTFVCLGLLMSLSAPALAANYKLTCDDGNIFEAPLYIEINGYNASASGSFSGPGSAIFTAEYKDLRVLNVVEKDGKLQSLTVTEPHVARQPGGFQLSLVANSKGVLKGKLSMTSTDEDKMPYNGKVNCSVK